MAHWLARLDDLIEKFERLVVLFFLTVMSGSVFLDVVHRVSAQPVLRVAAVLAGEAPPGPADEPVYRGPVVALLLAYAFFAGALHTASGADRRSLARTLVGGLVLTVATTTAIVLFVKLVPNGLVFSQPLALGLLLWVSLMGATLATKAKAHIVLEVADKIWPAPVLPYARLLSGLVAAGFCLVGAVLSVNFVADYVEQWREGVGYMSGIAVPRWVIFLALPSGFAVMGLRFLAYATADFLRRSEPKAEVAP
jgi:TRAP-type C4-dicarboxylate transport system permease small subunit